MTHDDDFSALLTKAKKGDEAAAEAVLRDVQQDLYLYIQNLTRAQQGPFEATDLLQTVLSEAWMRLARCEAESRTAFLAWLKRTAEHRLIDTIRFWKAEVRGGKVRHEGPQNSDRGLLFLVDEVTNGQTGPATGLEQGELKDIVRRAVESLADNYRLPVELFYFSGYSAADIANELEKSEGAIFVRLSRAREMLRDNVLRIVGTSVIG